MVGWLNYDIDTLRRIATQAMEQGFVGVKMKVGAPTLQEDVQRIEVVRAAIGSHGLLMVDANQVFSVNEALRLLIRLAKDQTQQRQPKRRVG